MYSRVSLSLSFGIQDTVSFHFFCQQDIIVNVLFSKGLQYLMYPAIITTASAGVFTGYAFLQVSKQICFTALYCSFQLWLWSPGQTINTGWTKKIILGCVTEHFCIKWVVQTIDIKHPWTSKQCPTDLSWILGRDMHVCVEHFGQGSHIMHGTKEMYADFFMENLTDFKLHRTPTSTNIQQHTSWKTCIILKR